jgi:hypothetical protein
VGNLTTEPKWNSDRRPNKRTGGLSTTETTVKLQRNQDAIRAIRYVFLAERQNEPKVTVRPPGPPPSHADRGMCFCEIQPQCQVLAERTQPVPTRMSLLGCPYLANAMAFRTRRRTDRRALRMNRRKRAGCRPLDALWFGPSSCTCIRTPDRRGREEGIGKQTFAPALIPRFDAGFSSRIEHAASASPSAARCE